VATPAGMDMLYVIKQWAKALSNNFVSVPTISTPSRVLISLLKLLSCCFLNTLGGPSG
jgi:hypothetical protein